MPKPTNIPSFLHTMSNHLLTAFSITLFFFFITVHLPVSTALNQEGLSLLSWLSTFNTTSSVSSSSLFSSWTPLDQNPCSWSFLECSGNGQVSELRIESVDLLTTFPTQILSFKSLTTLIISNANLTGEIPPAISNLSSTLAILDLSYNSLTGSVPPELGQLFELQFLSLNSNYLQGEIPREIGNCSKLRQVGLVDNLLSGELPKVLGLLSSLEVFRAGGNSQITGEIPSEISKCKGLVFLGLADTSISGEIPASIGELGNLQTLSIYTTNINGKIPSQIGNCYSLENLFLYENRLVGEIPPELGRLKKLKRILLWKNGLVGSIPESLGNCTELTVVDLSLNSLTGEIPSSWSNLIMLEELLLSENNISGQIPGFFGNFSHMKQLELDNNRLSGEIPSEIGRLKELTLFFAWQNQFHGNIPTELGNCEKLQSLDLSHNSLTGILPSSLFNLSNLTKLMVLSNGLSGEIPPDIGNCTGLTRLRLGFNRFSGQIPPEIGRLTSLSFLELSQNQLVGGIPPEIGNCTQLEMLDLHENMLQGTIPASLEYLVNLKVLDLSLNRISGPVNERLGKLISLNKLLLNGNYLTGLIPKSLGLCENLQLLDMSSNRISGFMPSEIGNLRGLDILLNLSWNYLSGPIPENFSNLSKLANLDLSHNMLAGSLNVLGSLENLVSLDVSYNNFSGFLPDTAFFHEIPVTALSGNRDLCSSGNECFVQVTNTKLNHKLQRRNLTRSILVSTMFCIALAAVITIMGIKMMKQAQKRAMRREEEENGGQWEITLFQKINFSIDEVLMKLSDSNIIGQGFSGVVYRVETATGQVIAVKKLWPLGRDDPMERDSFAAEVNTLASIRHKNIVRLLGCCANKKTKLLVFDYISNGNLFELLHEKKVFMDWQSRYKVLLGAAQGMAYLHHDCMPPVIHRDVKATNILVGPQFDAYLADFGLAEQVDPVHQAKSCDSVAGSYGYIAPEYGYSMKITEKSDVYSYGVVLLEVLTGMEPNDHEIPEGAHIVSWVRRELQRKEGAEVIDERLRGWPDSETEEMVQVLGVALLCVNQSPQERPAMKDVVAMLKEIKHETTHDDQDSSGKGNLLKKGFTNPNGGKCSSFSKSSQPLITTSSLDYSSSSSRIAF